MGALLLLLVIFFVCLIVFAWASFRLFYWALEPILKRERDLSLYESSESSGENYYYDECTFVVEEDGRQVKDEDKENEEFCENDEIKYVEEDEEIEIFYGDQLEDNQMADGNAMQNTSIGEKKELKISDFLKWMIIYRRNRPPRG